MVKKNKNKNQEKTLEKNLQDEVYVNYNLLLKLEEIKRVNYGIFEILNAFYQRILVEETPEKPKKSTKKKEEREGTLATRR